MNDKEFCMWLEKYAIHIFYITIIITILIYANK